MTLVVKKVFIKLNSDLWNRAGMMEILWTCAKLFVDIIPFFGCNCEVQKIRVEKCFVLPTTEPGTPSPKSCHMFTCESSSMQISISESWCTSESEKCSMSEGCWMCPSTSKFWWVLKNSYTTGKKNNCFYSSQKLTSNYQN